MTNERKCAVVLLGPPGSGKTTFAELAARRGMSVLGVGNLLENEIRRQTPLGQQIKPYKVAGRLVPSDLVKEVLSSELLGVEGRVILFDGFPRSTAQIDMFFHLLKEHHMVLCAVMILNIDSQTAINRITGRRVCVNCGAIYNVYTEAPKVSGSCDKCGGRLIQREDDRIDVVIERFRAYERDTLPVVEFFRNEFRHLTIEQSALKTPNELFARVRRRLEEAIPSKAL